MCFCVIRFTVIVFVFVCCLLLFLARKIPQGLNKNQSTCSRRRWEQLWVMQMAVMENELPSWAYCLLLGSENRWLCLWNIWLNSCPIELKIMQEEKNQRGTGFNCTWFETPVDFRLCLKIFTWWVMCSVRSSVNHLNESDWLTITCCWDIKAGNHFSAHVYAYV